MSEKPRVFRVLKTQMYGILRGPGPHFWTKKIRTLYGRGQKAALEEHLGKKGRKSLSFSNIFAQKKGR